MATNLTFSGAGFLAMYQIGVAGCLKHYGKKLLGAIHCYGGCSAGAMCAVGLLCDIEIEQGVLLFMDTAAIVREGTFGPFSSSFDPVNTIKKIFSASLPPDAYKIASGRLYISLTRVSDWKNVIVSEYASNNDLIDALACTTFIPFYCGIQPPKFRGVSYIDGGFSNNLLQHFEGTTITVSVFSGDSDICPDDGQKNNSMFDMNNVTVQCNGHNIYRLMKALFPPDSASLTELCRQGFKDALKYLISKYPEMLSIDVDIVSVPFNPSGRSLEDEQKSVSTTCAEKEEDSQFSDIEKTIAKEKAIKSLIIPLTVFELLVKAEQIGGERDFLYHAVNTIFRLTKWLAKPCYYVTKNIYDIANDLFSLLLPRLEAYTGNNLLVKKVCGMAKHAFYAYHGTAECEWHPSLGEDRQAEIVKTRRRLMKAEQSFVALRNTSVGEKKTKDVSVSLDGSDLPYEINLKDWTMSNDDVFEDDTSSKQQFSSAFFASFMAASRALLHYTSAEDDYGNSLDYANDGECADENHKDSMDDEEELYSLVGL